MAEIEVTVTRKEYRALQENETKEDDPSEIEDQATRKAYRALLKNEPKEVVLEQCKKFSDGPFHLLTIHKDTVLQVATSCKRADLVLELLKMVPNDQCHKLTDPNQSGNTILHEASTSNKLVLAAKEMLIKAPALLNKRNKFEVTPLFRSVVFGRMEVFKFLDKQIRKGKQTTDLQELEQIHFYNKSKDNILHAAVTNGSFDLAFFIAKKYKYLVYDKDKDGMTALQLLACNPLAFESRGGGGFLKRLKCSRDSIKEMSSVSEDESTEDVTRKEVILALPKLLTTFQKGRAEINPLLECAGRWRVPYWEKIQKKKKRHESALKLAKLLIKEDRSWKETEAMEDSEATKYYQPSQASATPSEKEENNTETGQPSKKKENKKIPEKPLILATRYGYVEMVKEILEEYPWAVEHVDHEGRTILHVAIKYRQIEVLDLVERMGVLRRLERKVDKNLNTILHMVGEETTDRIVPELRAPAFELQENLLLFERVREICPRSLLNTLNRQGMTAHQLFEYTNENLRGKANEWLKQTAENCSIVAVLIATVAFAAAYTIPGGSDQNGFPVFLNQPFFVVFTMTDVLSLTFALTSVIIFLRILTSPFHLNDFKQSLLQMQMLGITFLITSVTLMMMAFVATVLLTIQNQRDWTKVALYTAAVLPVFIFTLSYMPLYLSLMTTVSYSLNKVKTIFCGYSKSKPEQIGTSNSTYPLKHRASPNLV